MKTYAVEFEIKGMENIEAKNDSSAINKTKKMARKNDDYVLSIYEEVTEEDFRKVK